MVATSLRLAAALILAGVLAGCGTTSRAVRAPVSENLLQPVQTGYASWYGKAHQGRTTSSGEPYDMNKLTAAHSSLPLNTVVEVTNLANGKKVQVKVNDRGMQNSGEIDLSLAAARAIGMVQCGLALVVLSVVPTPAKGK